MFYTIIKTTAKPIGDILLVSDGKNITGLQTHKNKKTYKEILATATKKPNLPLFKKAEKQMREYLAGKRDDFDLPLALDGTDFQKKVWRALQKIPFGKTRSYGDIAKSIGNPKASRAVGMANNKNPVGIIVPCHRVIGADGSMTGYGGGIPMKKFLLTLEEK